MNLRQLTATVQRLLREVNELRRSARPMPVRDPIAPDPGVPFKVVSYNEPAQPGRYLSAQCVRTDGQKEGSAETRIIMHDRVRVGETIFAIRTKPYIEDPGASGSGEGSAAIAYRWVQIPFTPGALLARTVCQGPHGEDQLTPPSVWCQVLQITAGCDHSDAWSTSTAPEIVDPCTGSGDGGGGASTMPHILEGVNLGDHVDPSPIQPGKLVLLTPLSVVSSPHRPRYAISYIDPTDNNEACDESSSESESESESESQSSSSGDETDFCLYRYTYKWNCATSTEVQDVTFAEKKCGPKSGQPYNLWFCDGKAGDVLTMSKWVDEANACPTEGECPDPQLATKPDAPTEAEINACCDASSSSSGGGSDGSGSDKSTAIVPVKWSPTGYAALFTLEAPEVRFDDVQVVSVDSRTTRVSIDPRFVSVCEAGSIDVCGTSADQPVSVGASVDGGELVLRLTRKPRDRVRVVVRLTGIRRGFAGKRFPYRTAAQFVANERFLNSAYPGAGKA